MSVSAIRFFFLSTHIYDANLQNIAVSMKKNKKKAIFFLDWTGGGVEPLAVGVVKMG
jgi:hypothetical protein